MLLLASAVLVSFGLAQASVKPTRGTCPQSHPIKGSISSTGERIYHEPDGRFYKRTRPEICFRTAADARQAGFRASLR